MPDPNREIVEDIIYTTSPADLVEREAALAIQTLRVQLEAWFMSYQSGASTLLTGSAIAAAQRGHGEGVAKIVDAVIRLRAQKLGW